MILQNILVVPGQHHDRNGRTLVRSTLQVSKGLHKHKADIHGALAVLQSLCMTVPKDHDHIVDGFFQWFDCPGLLIVFRGKCVHCDPDDLIDRLKQQLQFPSGRLRKADSIIM